ncbi:glutathione S-transferase family protein [Thioalkalivibrio sp. XN279]|uniref:glutathione S-transferase family protein n=1 Tax=Thioalkalivibrio sp. XN279 TaxID=2714953 RepID=UPI00140942A3|nr:glutathione S-transferase family protein [Thioalkalivibrio sp. XN279]NHA13869.1 glutathione S-transferase family protein [Thioalkalivibrio sp. XN279]
MGLLVEGKWRDEWYDTESTGGKFVRSDAVFRNWVTADGTAGPTGEGGFRAEPGRYHLYVSLACPWAHRTLIFRALKGLQDAVSVSVVHPDMLENGWEFRDCAAGEFTAGDPLFGSDYLHQVYTRARPDYTGRVTVPVLWDRERETIVSNESADIIRMLNSAFAACAASDTDYYPAGLRAEIDAVNKRVYAEVNNGVYRCGFATTQEAYEEAFGALFAALDWLDERLARQPFLAGDRLTEADWRLFTTLLRFDPVYVGHFKANLRRIRDYPQLSNYTRQLYQVPGVAATVNLDHIKRHYYYSHRMINPTGVVPLGPELDLDAPHDRDPLPA